MQGVEAFVNAYQGSSTYAIRQGLRDMGVEDNSLLVFSELMNSKSLFLTPNADTPYLWGFIDVSNGPMVSKCRRNSWARSTTCGSAGSTDVGFPGPDRGEGGRYLILPPGYDGPVPEGGYFVARSRTTRAS